MSSECTGLVQNKASSAWPSLRVAQHHFNLNKSKASRSRGPAWGLCGRYFKQGPSSITGSS